MNQYRYQHLLSTRSRCAVWRFPVSDNHHETSPVDRIRLSHKFVYGLWSLTNNILAAASENLMIDLDLTYGTNPLLLVCLEALRG